jgi:hypothetical protein
MTIHIQGLPRVYSQLNFFELRVPDYHIFSELPPIVSPLYHSYPPSKKLVSHIQSLSTSSSPLLSPHVDAPQKLLVNQSLPFLSVLQPEMNIALPPNLTHPTRTHRATSQMRRHEIPRPTQIQHRVAFGEKDTAFVGKLGVAHAPYAACLHDLTRKHHQLTSSPIPTSGSQSTTTQQQQAYVRKKQERGMIPPPPPPSSSQATYTLLLTTHTHTHTHTHVPPSCTRP